MTSKNIPTERQNALSELLEEYPVMSMALHIPDLSDLKRIILQNKEIECPHALEAEAETLKEYILTSLNKIGFLDSNMLSLKEINLNIMSALSRYIKRVVLEYFFPEQCEIDPLTISHMKEIFSRKIEIPVRKINVEIVVGEHV